MEHEVIRKTYADRIPPTYSWRLHLVFQLSVGIGVSGLAIHFMSGRHFLLLPLFIILANLIEWFYHKNAMHKVLWGMDTITKEHVGEHHSMFIAGDMPIREAKELHAVLLAPVSLLVAYTMILLPAGIMMFFLPQVSLAWIAAGALYFVIYEALHTLYHLPLNGRIFRWLRKQHETHHDVRYMQRYNFNVTFPFWDVIMKTYRP